MCQPSFERDTQIQITWREQSGLIWLRIGTSRRQERTASKPDVSQVRQIAARNYQTKFCFGHSNSISACVRSPRDSRGVVLVLKAQRARLSSAAFRRIPWRSVSQPPVRGSVPGPGTNYTGPRGGSPGICHFSFLRIFHE